MCNIAAYVGTKPAAPILLEMMRREEGFNGGYYTGIATIHEGKIYSAKLTGDTQRLIDCTEAANLPGTIGIIHGRSKSGGGDEWAHPFIGSQKGEAITAYVANGAPGFFAPRAKEYNAKAQQMVDAGIDFPSRVKFDNDIYQKLNDGSMIHMSDFMCQSITQNILKGQDGKTAIANAFCENPSEIVGLLLSTKQPDRIIWSRINRPMTFGFSSHGAYMATTHIAFPEDAGEATTLPACTAGYMFKDKVEITPLHQKTAQVAKLDMRVRVAVYETVCKMLREGNPNCEELEEACIPLFEKADCTPMDTAVYEVLYSLLQEGRLHIETKMVEGAFEWLQAPEFRMSLKE